jgi:DNA-binding response OmpR family regulator
MLFQRTLPRRSSESGLPQRPLDATSSDSEQIEAAVVMIVDDQPQVRVMLVYALRQHGFEAQEASSGEEALKLLDEREPDIVLLDLLMPGLNGETCRRIRERSVVPVIMLTALGGDEDVVAGLDAGADDYCPKPVSVEELAGRIRAQLRRRRMDAVSKSSSLYHDGRDLITYEGDLIVNEPTRQVIVKGRAVDLTPREFQLLYRLARSPGRVVPQQELLQDVWGITSTGHAAVLRSYIKLLRQKIEPHPRKPQYIRSRAGLGYVLTGCHEYQ